MCEWIGTINNFLSWSIKQRFSWIIDILLCRPLEATKLIKTSNRSFTHWLNFSCAECKEAPTFAHNVFALFYVWLTFLIVLEWLCNSLFLQVVRHNYTFSLRKIYTTDWKLKEKHYKYLNAPFRSRDFPTKKYYYDLNWPVKTIKTS